MPLAFSLERSSGTLFFDSPLTEALLIERPNRYVAQVALADGTVHRSHVPVGGRIGGLTLDGLPCLISGPYEGRTTSHTVEAIGSHFDRNHAQFQWIGINQTASNRYVGGLLRAGLLPELLDGIPSDTVQAERKLAGKRIDFSVGRADPPELWVEVKTPLISLDTPLDSELLIKTDFSDGGPSARMPEQFIELAKELKRGSRVVFLGVFGYSRQDHLNAEARYRLNLNLDGLVDRGLELGMEFGELELSMEPWGIRSRGYRKLFG